MDGVPSSSVPTTFTPVLPTVAKYIQYHGPSLTGVRSLSKNFLSRILDYSLVYYKMGATAAAAAACAIRCRSPPPSKWTRILVTSVTKRYKN